MNDLGESNEITVLLHCVTWFFFINVFTYLKAAMEHFF